ncbi:MAG: LAGLIDADG family homing endonuclease [Actinomycetota bacterium]|nr:LAGLIDADG family homing endonuclease [Actinomycetota bacterium]
MSQRVTPEHVAGLVVGEGCFYAESGKDKKYRSGWRIRPAFCIEMRSDDREVLEIVRAHLDCGNVHDLDFGRYRGYEDRGWKPHAKYRVSRLSDLHLKVVPFFEEHQLFGRKLRAFDLFSELVRLMATRDHLTPEGLQMAKQLAAKLTEHNKKG